jgi:hypothetical protein
MNIAFAHEDEYDKRCMARLADRSVDRELTDFGEPRAERG